MYPDQPEPDAPGDDEIVEEEDVDLDLGDLAGPKSETVLERLQRAAQRGSARNQGVNWRDTPVNVTPSGRHEIIEEEQDLTDEDELVHGQAAQAVTPSGRHEVVDEDLDLDEADAVVDEIAPRVTPSGRHEVVEEDDDSVDVAGVGIGDADDLDESSLVAASREELVEESEFEPGRPETETMVEGTATVAETRLEHFGARGPGRDTERGIPRSRFGQAETEAGEEARDDTEVAPRDETPLPPPPKVRDTERSPAVPQSDGSDVEEGPESDTAQESGAESDTPQDLAQIPSGATGPVLVDNSATVREEAGETRLEGSTQDEDDFSAPRAVDNQAAHPEGQGARDGATNARQKESAEPTEPAGTLSTGLGAVENNEAEKNTAARGDDGGTVPPQRPHAEPSEVHSQRPEGFTVADDSGAPLGRGLDVGTANLVAARMDEEGGIEFFPARNAFLDVPEDPYTLKMLKGQGVPYIKRENRLYVIGEDAFELANIFNREMRRPMKNGLISPTDVDAMPMEVELFKKILGPPRAEGEMVYYSIPADPVDSTLNIVYHTNIANGLLERLGYRGTPFNEGQAIVFSELGDDDFTGIGISCGGGMVNVCVAFRSMNVIIFSSAKGGDWIDQQAAQVMGCAASKITAIKERGVDINAPKTPEEEAIVIYYRHLIKYSLENIVKKFAVTKDIPNFPKPVPIAISGGTSKVGGFVDVFKDEFSKMATKFPIKISDIRRAEDQLNATAKGCLLAALSHED
ncbi:MAG: hypothetical protein HS108_11830 [Planctomycetes bacterium]|nr:hypothetical protein [Planctomycetota bacterium]